MEPGFRLLCCSEPEICKKKWETILPIVTERVWPDHSSIVGSDLQRNRLDICSLFSRISRIDNSSSGSIAPQSAKLAETQSFAISDTRNKIQTHNPEVRGSNPLPAT
jgi:hypothetical protein